MSKGRRLVFRPGRHGRCPRARALKSRSFWQKVGPDFDQSPRGSRRAWGADLRVVSFTRGKEGG